MDTASLHDRCRLDSLVVRGSLLGLLSFCVDSVHIELHKPALYIRQLCQLIVHLVAQQQEHIHAAQNLETQTKHEITQSPIVGIALSTTRAAIVVR